MPRPAHPPIGPHLAGAARRISRAFDDALAQAGGSMPNWLILLSVKTCRLGNQRELADAVGIRGATLTHHLNAMESAGLVVRRRDPANRRIQTVELTEKGETAFHAMRVAAVAFDQRLRHGVSEEELAGFERVLDKLHGNVVAGVPSDDGECAG